MYGGNFVMCNDRLHEIFVEFKKAGLLKKWNLGLGLRLG